MRPVLLLLAGAALAAEPGFDDIFDPGKWPEGTNRTANRHAAFEKALAARGPGAALTGFRGCERAVEELRDALDKEYARYRKLRADWFGWRRQYEADYQRRHGRPPAEWPVPQGLNKAFLDGERAFKRSRALLFEERLFHEWAFERVRALLADGDERAVARGLSDRAPEQRMRCARLASPEVAAAAAERESHPGVLAVLAEAAPSEALLAHHAWPVRAGAIRGAAKLGTRQAAGWLVARLGEPGSLADDLLDALRRTSGEDIGYDPEKWRAWHAKLPADWRGKGGGAGEGPPPGPYDEPKVPGVFSEGRVSFFGIRSSTRAAVYCVQASAAWEQIREEVKRSVGTLPDGAQFGVVAYDSAARLFKPSLVEANDSSRQALEAWLQKLEPDGGADLFAGGEAALALAAGKSKVPAADTIFLASVTKPPEGTLFEDLRQVTLEILARNALLGIRIHCVGPSDGGTSFHLHHIANQWSGSHVNG